MQVLFEDNHFIAVNKPGGLLVQGDETGDKTLVDWVKYYIKERYDKPGDVYLGVIHRIDRPVSGVVIFARTSKGLERMNALFRDRKVKKTYLAITHERPKKFAGRLENYLWKDRTKNKTKVLERPSRRHPDAKKSVLEYELHGDLNHHSLLKINPITGRSHQIRAQLAAIGTPIRGDLKYGSKIKNQDGTIDLHSYRLEFEHPIKKEPVVIEATPPDNSIWDWFQVDGI